MPLPCHKKKLNAAEIAIIICVVLLLLDLNIQGTKR
jgi:hypothetical protein